MGRRRREEAELEDRSNNWTIPSILAAERITAAATATRECVGIYVRETQGGLSPAQVKRMTPVLRSTGDGFRAILRESGTVEHVSKSFNAWLYDNCHVEEKPAPMTREAARARRQVKRLESEGRGAA